MNIMSEQIEFFYESKEELIERIYNKFNNRYICNLSKVIYEDYIYNDFYQLMNTIEYDIKQRFIETGFSIVEITKDCVYVYNIVLHKE